MMQNHESGANADVLQAQAVLVENEEAVLVVRPRISLSRGRAFLLLLPSVIALLWVLWATLSLGADCWVPLVFGSPFLLIAGVLGMSPLWHRVQMARTVYMLTNRRVVILAPVGLQGSRCVSFPLRPSPVLKVVKRRGGYGDIIFAWERRWQLGARVYSLASPVGFMDVPQVARVLQMLEEQVAALPEDAALSAVEGVEPLPMNRQGRPRVLTVERAFALWVGGACCGVSLLLLLHGASALPGELGFRENAVTTTGTVLSLRRELHEFSPHVLSEKVGVLQPNGVRRHYFAMYYPTVRFTDEKGRTHTVECPVAQPTSKLPPNRQMTISYHRRNPAWLAMGKPSRRGMTFCILSLLAFIVGVAIASAGLIRHPKPGV